jgi:hypothetical protein
MYDVYDHAYSCERVHVYGVADLHIVTYYYYNYILVAGVRGPRCSCVAGHGKQQQKQRKQQQQQQQQQQQHVQLQQQR